MDIELQEVTDINETNVSPEPIWMDEPGESGGYQNGTYHASTKEGITSIILK